MSPRLRPSLLTALLVAASAQAGGDWISFTDETDSRLVADPSVGTADEEEKDYAWGDVDRDGDTDLVVVRKQPVTTAGGRRNVLFLNEHGVLTDLTLQYISDFLDETNDRDVQLMDVDNDTWLDIVTAAACYSCELGITDDSRLYLNRGDDGNGNWLGFDTPTVLLGDGNNLNAVAAGDVTGDGYADLYFVSAIDSFEDQLLINGGPDNPGVFTVENERMTAEMLQSSFGTNAVIADMDGDGDNDIVKCPEGLVQMFRNDGTGVFDFLDPTYSGAAYYVEAGDLNNDGMLDLVIQDDGTDRYILNDGNLFDGEADITFNFPDTTQGFGSNALIVDLDDDGWNDVIICDVDVDVPGCARVTDILRNDANPPDVTFSYDPANLKESDLQGIFDVAVFDIDGDGDKDLVSGRCSGTQIWIVEQIIGCPWDLDGSGDVGVEDFLELLANWGDPYGINDFLDLLANWGPCP